MSYCFQQTFRHHGVSNSEECIFRTVALNSIRRWMGREGEKKRRGKRGTRSSIAWSMIRWREVEVNRSNGISWKRCESGRGGEGEGGEMEGMNEWMNGMLENEWIDQRAEWLNRFIWQIRLADRDCLFILFYFILYTRIKVFTSNDFCDQTFTIDFILVEYAVVPRIILLGWSKNLFRFFVLSQTFICLIRCTIIDRI